MDSLSQDYLEAINDFRQARSRGEWQSFLSRLRGASDRLLSYDEVRQQLKAEGGADRGLRDIPLNAIVGSLGRYTDFTRDFLPRKNVDEERWARVKMAVSDMAGLPPIEVYQIGQVYFVKDGNHRVSVAHQLGATHIQAYVTEIQIRVPLTPDIQPDDLIIKAEYVEFLEQTCLDKARPEADLSVTIPGQYQILAEHINVHRYYMGIDYKRGISYPEAALHWYETVYMPVVQVIRDLGIMGSFPGRTETDLYLWVSEHRASLQEDFGLEILPAAAAVDLAFQAGSQNRSALSRIGEKLLDTLLADTLEAGPPPGSWRKEVTLSRPAHSLFRSILVPVNGEEDGWYALSQALVVAEREKAVLYGLHVLTRVEGKPGSVGRDVEDEFKRRCSQAGVAHEMNVVTGEVSVQICSHARWTDLVITTLAHPPGAQPLARLGSGFRTLIQRCPRPILAVPQMVSPLNSATLAYDGSPKAEEALFIATYLAAQWHIPLTVITVTGDDTSGDSLGHAQQYIETHQVKANYLVETGPVAEKVLTAVKGQHSDLLIMGGYGHKPLLEVILGSAVDQALRESQIPVLICR